MKAQIQFALTIFLLLGLACLLYYQKDTESTSTVAIVEEGFCLEGCPTGAPPDNKVISHHIFELSNNPHTKFADWVAYKITPDTLGSGCKRRWEQDPDLHDSETLSPGDYIGMHTSLASDRGHQAPLASLCGSSYWQEADYLSNITPQKSDLNEGAWEHLENAERNLIKKNMAASVYSITGPLYERAMPNLPRAHILHRIPSGYWKIISIRTATGIKISGFIMDQNSPKEANYCQTEVPIIDIEHRSHLIFSPNAIDRQNIEAKRKDNALTSELGCR